MENGDVTAQSKPRSPLVEEDDLNMGMADFSSSSRSSRSGGVGNLEKGKEGTEDNDHHHVNMIHAK